MFTSVTQVLPHVRSGKIKMLAVGAAKRIPAVPDIPTVAEAGFPGYEVAVWWGVDAPAGVPRPVLEKLRRELSAILRDPETEKLLARDAAQVIVMPPTDFRKMIHDEVRKWTGVAQTAGIHVQ